MNTPRKDKCMYEGEHGVCTRVQGCSESREESAEPAPKGVSTMWGFKCNWPEGFLYNRTQGSIGKRNLTQDRDCRALGRAALCGLCGLRELDPLG